VGAGQGQQGAEFFLGDPGGEQLPGGLVGRDLVPHAGGRPVGQPFAGAEKAAPVRPGRIGLHAAPAEPLA
jgi:hypothetical protein